MDRSCWENGYNKNDLEEKAVWKQKEKNSFMDDVTKCETGGNWRAIETLGGELLKKTKTSPSTVAPE